MFVLPREWARDFENRMEVDARASGRTTAEAVAGLRDDIQGIERKLDRLMDLYIAQDIERDAYLSKRRVLLSDKRSIQEQIARLERDGNAWLEPMRAWITEAENLAQIRISHSLPAKKSALQKIFGSNLILLNQKVSGTAHPVYAAVAAAREKLGTMESNLVWAPLAGRVQNP